jgi:hypothetical protein
MSVTVETINQEKALGLGRIPAWFWLGAGVYLLQLVNGSNLLRDSDTYWHIAAGKWIIAHHAVPRVDIYSFTKAGEPWISTSWLAQVLYGEAFELAGWAGPIVLACNMHRGNNRAPRVHSQPSHPLDVRGCRCAGRPDSVDTSSVCASTCACAARDGCLVYGLVSASESREAPSFRLLPLMALWANLHGGFVFGLALLAPFALDALWNQEGSRRTSLALRWIAFGVCALAASCVTPYGWESILAARKILDLGELLHLIYEWMPADFSRFGPFQACLFVLIAGALYCGVKLSPPRIVLVLILFHMALSHVRNTEIFALLMPLVVLSPLSSQFGLHGARSVKMTFPLASAASLVAMLGISTWAFTANHKFSPTAIQSPAAAVDVLKDRNARRVLNDLPFAGYLISRELPVFVDGRAELYGESFEMAYYRALQLQDINLFLDILKTYEIDAVLLTPSTPAAGLLDHLDGWQRVYSDETTVLHIRTAH